MSESSKIVLMTNPVRPALASTLAGANCQIVAETRTLSEAESLARRLRPDAALLCVTSTLLAAVQVTQRLVGEGVTPVFWLADLPEISPMLDMALSAGVMGLHGLPLRAGEMEAALRLAAARFKEAAQKEAEIKTLTAQMEARKLVGRAKALLMERYNLSERDAFRRIQSQSVTLGKPAYEIARAIITASEMGI